MRASPSFLYRTKHASNAKVWSVSTCLTPRFRACPTRGLSKLGVGSRQKGGILGGWKKTGPACLAAPTRAGVFGPSTARFLRLETGARRASKMSRPKPLFQQMGGRSQLYLHFDLQFLPGGSWVERTSHWLGWGFSTRLLGSVRLKVSHRRRPSPLGAIFLRAGESPNRKTARPFLKVGPTSNTPQNVWGCQLHGGV